MASTRSVESVLTNPAVRALATKHTGYHRTFAFDSYNRPSAETRTAFTFQAYHYNTSPKERLLLPEGIRQKAVYTMLTEEPLTVGREATSTTTGVISDVIEIGGRTYEILSEDSVGDHPVLGLRHYTYVLALENPA